MELVTNLMATEFVAPMGSPIEYVEIRSVVPMALAAEHLDAQRGVIKLQTRIF